MKPPNLQLNVAGEAELWGVGLETVATFNVEIKRERLALLQKLPATTHQQ